MESCAECAGIVMSWPAESTSIVCATCGAELTCPPDHPRPEAAVDVPRTRRERTRSDAPKDTPHAIRRYIDDVLRWDLALSKIEQRERGTASPIYGMLEAARISIPGTIGMHGSGCSGTKGVGRKPSDDAHSVLRLDPLSTARYRSLRGDALATTDAVIADGAGDQLVQLHLAGEKRNPYQCTLAQRVALISAPSEMRAEWQRRIVRGDSLPALAAMEENGSRSLVTASVAWWSFVAS
jgi:hypothetical protein